MQKEKLQISAFLRSTFCILLFFGVAGAANASNQDFAPQYNLYQLPSAKAALRLLEEQVAFVWENKPLRAGLESLSETHRISIWLDRRVDPGQLVSFQMRGDASERTLLACLQRIAELVNADVGLIENVVYFGPEDSVPRIQLAALSLHDAICVQNQSSDTRLLELDWEELATPNDLLGQISLGYKVRLSGELPHDLLHAGKLQSPTSIATQLALVCGGFDRQANLQSADAFSIGPLSSKIQWQFEYATAELNPISSAKSGLRRLLAKFGGTLRDRRTSVLVTGPTGLHLALLKPAAKGKVGETDFEGKIWSLEVENKPAELLLGSIASSIGFRVQWDSACSLEQRNQLVTFKQENADLDQLLQAFAEASGLRVERKGSDVSVRPTND